MASTPSQPRTRVSKTENRAGRRWASRNGGAEHAVVSVRTIDRLIADGKLRAYRVPGGRLVRIDLNELDALLTPIASPVE